MSSLPKGKSKMLFKSGDLKQPLVVGLRWDPKMKASMLEKLQEMTGGKTTFTDMDLSAYVYDRKRNFLGLASAKAEDITVFTPHIYHSGDSMDGESIGDDERVTVEFEGLDDSVGTIIFKADIASGHVFKDISLPEIKLYYEEGHQIILKNQLDAQNNKSAFVFVRLYRDGDDNWHVENIEEFTDSNDNRPWSEDLKVYLR